MAGFSPQTPPVGTNASTQSPSMLLQSPESGGWAQEKAFRGLCFQTVITVRACAVAPLWQRQMDWEPPYLPEEAVYGSSSRESRRSLKFSFQSHSHQSVQSRPDRASSGASLSGKTSQPETKQLPEALCSKIRKGDVVGQKWCRRAWKQMTHSVSQEVKVDYSSQR